MAPNPRKRKAVTRDVPVESESEGELADGLLDGILSHSEGESDVEQAEEDDSDASSVIEGLSDEDAEDEDEDEGAFSDTDLEDGEADIREQMRKLNTKDAPIRLNGVDHALGLDSRAAEHGLEEQDEERNYTVTTDANGNPRYLYKEIDPVYESDDSDAEAANTIGNIPLSYYDEYPHRLRHQW